MKKCISCGMDLIEVEDYPLDDITKDYCVHCANEDGTMHNYDQAILIGTKYFMSLNHWSFEQGKEECIKYLDTMPAWKNKRTEKWLYEHARKLEIAKWNYLFNNNSKENILYELLKYQNEDGGFGNSLESDIRTPESSAIASIEAIFTMLEYDIEFRGDWFYRLLSYFENNLKNHPSYYDSIPSSTNEYPHAPWWNYEVPKVFSPNPTAVISALFIKFGNDNQRNIGFKIASDVLAFIKTDKNNYEHDTFCLQAFCEILKSHHEIVNNVIINKVKNRIVDSVNLNVNEWNQYVMQPLDFINSPNSIWYDILKNYIAMNLDYINKKISENGYLVPPFSWGIDSDISKLVTKEWIGYLTVKRFKVLKEFINHIY